MHYSKIGRSMSVVGQSATSGLISDEFVHPSIRHSLALLALLTTFFLLSNV